MNTEMTAFSDRIQAARENRPTRDVSVVLDGELSRELEALQAELESVDTGDVRMGVKSPAVEIEERMQAVREAAQDSVVVLRFTRLSGREWTNITSHWTPRPDVPIDKHYGYDYDSVCEAAAIASGVRIEDGEPVPMSADEWRDLFDVLSGSDVGEIRDAQWALNEYEPRERLNILVKDFGAATRSEQI